MPPATAAYNPPCNKPNFELALVCASITADYDRSWLAKPICDLIPPGGPRPERISRLKARVQPGVEHLLAEATQRGRPHKAGQSPEVARAAVHGELLTLATGLLRESRVPFRRPAIQARLVAAYDRIHAQHHVTITDFCNALALSERTFRSWRSRPAAPPLPPAPRPEPQRKKERRTGRFRLEATAPGIQLGSDTSDLRLCGVDLKLVAAQDIGAREQRLWEAFAIDEHETSDLIAKVIQEAAANRQGLQLITDQGKPFLAEAARNAYEAIGVEHEPQKEGAPTEKASVERAFGTAKQALAPLFELSNRLAEMAPALRNPELARTLGTLLVAVFLRVYIAGRRHLEHPLKGHDPDQLAVIIEQQRETAHAEFRSKRLFLEGIHAEYAMPGNKEDFIRAFKHYPLEDLIEAERRFRRYACRCHARLCDRYFAAVVRNVHDKGRARRAADQQRRRNVVQARAAKDEAHNDARDLLANPERAIHEGLNLLADTWQPDGFLFGGKVARDLLLRPALHSLQQRDPATAHDETERYWRSWRVSRPQLASTTEQSVRGVLTQLIPEVLGPAPSTFLPSDFVDVIQSSTAQDTSQNQRPLSPTPHLRI